MFEMKKIATTVLLLTFSFVMLWGQKKKEINVPVTVNYCLPKVCYQVRVKMQHIRHIPGPYAQYAEKMLGVAPEITSVTESWKIKDIQIIPVYLPDAQALYTVQASGDYGALLLSLSPEGFLAGVSVARNDFRAGHAPVTYTFSDQTDDSVVDISKLKLYNPQKELLDSNFMEQEVNGVKRKIWDPIARYEVKTDEEAMDEAAKEIFRIRTDRVRLLSMDETSDDAGVLALLLAELDRAEEEYLSFFMGKKEVHVVEQTFAYTPEKAGRAEMVFRFSEKQGVNEKKNGTPYSLVVENIQLAAGEDVSSESQASLPSLYYRIPAMADVKLMRFGDELLRFRNVVPQLGIIRSFPLDVISNEQLSLEFYPEYGSIKSINRK